MESLAEEIGPMRTWWKAFLNLVSSPTQRNGIMTLADIFIDANIIATETHIWWCGFGCYHDVAADGTVGRK
jgi:hypothetical protein